MPIQILEIPAGAVTLEVPLLDNKSTDRAIGRIDTAWRLATPSGRRRGRGHRLLLDGLIHAGAVLPTTGRKVESKVDAIGWLLEAVSLAFDAHAKEAGANGDPVGPAGGKCPSQSLGFEIIEVSAVGLLM